MTKQERIFHLKFKVPAQKDKIEALRSDQSMDERIKLSQIESAKKELERLEYDLRILTT